MGHDDRKAIQGNGREFNMIRQRNMDWSQACLERKAKQSYCAGNEAAWAPTDWGGTKHGDKYRTHIVLRIFLASFVSHMLMDIVDQECVRCVRHVQHPIDEIILSPLPQESHLSHDYSAIL